MDASTILLISEALRALLRGWIEIIRQSNLTEEEKEAHFQEITDTFKQYAPDKLTPAP